MERRLGQAVAAYVAAFGKAPAWPLGVEDELLASTVERAVQEGKPIPDDFDWWAGLPGDAIG